VTADKKKLDTTAAARNLAAAGEAAKALCILSKTDGVSEDTLAVCVESMTKQIVCEAAAGLRALNKPECDGFSDPSYRHFAPLHFQRRPVPAFFFVGGLRHRGRQGYEAVEHTGCRSRHQHNAPRRTRD
jgi:hypothetical protein